MYEKMKQRNSRKSLSEIALLHHRNGVGAEDELQLASGKLELGTMSSQMQEDQV
jgi:hypothetical protein